MSNRKASLIKQLVTIAGFGSLWLVAKAMHRHKGGGKEVYSINYRLYGILSIVLLAADVYAIPAVLRGKRLIDTDELKEISVVKMSKHLIKLAGLTSQRVRYKGISDNALKLCIALPFLLLLDSRFRRDAGTLGILYLWLHAVTYTIYSFSPLGPAFVDKYRPVVYYEAIPEDERAFGNNRNASYSGHTSSAACATFFMAKVYSDYHPNINPANKYGLYTLAYLPPLLVGWLRTRALKHFPIDVLQAIAIGGGCGIIIPELYRNSDAWT